MGAPPNNTVFTSSTPTVDTGAYGTGELIGGKLTFSNCLSHSRSGFITCVLLSDKAAQAVDLELVIFGSDPTGTTFTDQAAFDIADADLTKIQAIISLGSASRFAYADNGVKYLGSLALPLKSAAGSGTIYGALVSRGTPTFAAASDVTVTLGISQD